MFVLYIELPEKAAIVVVIIIIIICLYILFKQNI